MASIADREAAHGSGPDLTAFIDRWIYVFIAGLFMATVFVGFIPDSIEKVSAIMDGTRPPFPPVLHVHAVLMGTWLLLLLTQTTLMATGRSAMHKQLGVAAMVLAPAMVLTGFFLVPAMVQYNWARLLAAPAGTPPETIETAKNFLSSLVAAQIAVGVLFAIIVFLGLRVRKTDPETHKRLMILATVLPLPAAIDRIGWLPTSYPEGCLSVFLYTVLWISPMLLWDLYRHKRLLRAYVIWFAFFIPTAVLVINLWWTPGWIASSQHLMGVAG